MSFTANPICTIRIYASGNKEKKYYMGAGIKFTAVVSPDNPTTVLFSIKDPGGTILVNSVPMVQESTNVFSYIYQSGVYDVYGKYTAIVNASSGSTSAQEVLEIAMLEQPGLLM